MAALTILYFIKFFHQEEWAGPLSKRSITALLENDPLFKSYHVRDFSARFRGCAEAAIL